MHFRRIFYLLLVIVKFTQSNITASLSRQNLTLNLLNLDSNNVNLVTPFLFAAFPTSTRQAKRRLRVKVVGNRMGNSRPNRRIFGRRAIIARVILNGRAGTSPSMRLGTWRCRQKLRGDVQSLTNEIADKCDIGFVFVVLFLGN